MKGVLCKLSILTLITLLCACVSQPAYREASNNGYGYTEQQLSNNQYRVEFKARGDDVGRAIDYAMYRSSEIALRNEFDWFIVTDREILLDEDEVGPEAAFGSSFTTQTITQCGLLECRSYTRPIHAFDSQMMLGDGRREVEIILDVRMGNGIRPEQIESFDTREVYQRLQPEEADTE